MDRLHIDFSRIQRLDVVRLRTQLPGKGPPRRPAGSIERPVISTAIDAAAHVSNTAKLLKEIKNTADLARRIPVSLVGTRGPMLIGPGPITAITIGAGAASSVFAGIGVTMGAGLYGSTTRELGLYTTQGTGIWTNAGVATDLQLTYVLGPPASFGGLSWGVGISCDIPGVGMGIGCTVLFGASGPPYALLGWCVGVGAGVTVLPATISFQAASTQLIPI